MHFQPLIFSLVRSINNLVQFSGYCYDWLIGNSVRLKGYGSIQFAWMGMTLDWLAMTIEFSWMGMTLDWLIIQFTSMTIYLIDWSKTPSLQDCVGEIESRTK